MRWARHELVYELRQDVDRRVLFVEGLRDLSFWRMLIPSHQRKNGAIYEIKALESPVGPDGERGRIIRSAASFLSTPVSDRVRFFCDADFDRLLATRLPANVILTDGRDLESYALSESCLERIARICFPASTYNGAELLTSARLIVRPIGVLRLVARKNGLDFPFRRTFDNNFGRFLIAGPEAPTSIDINGLIRILIQNSGGSLRDQSEILQSHSMESEAYKDTPDVQLIHGKDLLRFLSWRFGVQLAEMERHLFMSALHDIEEIRNQQNILTVREWLTWTR